MADYEGDLDGEIEAQVEEWSTNSTEAFHIQLYPGTSDQKPSKPTHIFDPEFTYPIFGEEEAIFGYQGLEISLAFAAHNLTPHVDIKYTSKFPNQGEVRATDIRAALQDFLPKTALDSGDSQRALRDDDAASFTPPGTMVHSYAVEDKKFEIWSTSLADPAARQILKNMQILVPLFIEGGTILELEYPWIVERWRVFFLYNVDTHPSSDTASPYSIAGYSTAFVSFTFPEKGSESQGELLPAHISETEVDNILEQWKQKDPSFAPSLPSRERISQFIILPPYQGAGHGAQLYGTMYAQLTAPANVFELTVEDPNEAFDDLRDVCDMLFLRLSNRDFEGLQVNTTIDPTSLKGEHEIPVGDIISGEAKERIRKQSKIMPRQLSRLIEMHTLSKIPKANRSVYRITRKEKTSNLADRAYYFWRLYVKQRVYNQNRDALVQLDSEERLDKVEGVLEGLQQDYERILDMVEKRAGYAFKGYDPEGQENGNGHKTSVKKRRLVVDEDEDDEDEEEPESETKKQRRK